MTDERCKTCRLWDEEGANPLQNVKGETVNESAYCRYHAPAAGRDPWPRTFATDYCGRWENRDKQE